MSEEARRRSLGRGLSALFEREPEQAQDTLAQRSFKTVPVELLTPGPLQPRRRFEEEELEALAASIRENGIVQPILVRPRASDGYEIVAGERRWRAAQRAQLHEVPIVIARSTIGRPWSCRWSRTSSAAISTRSRRPTATAG